MAKQKILYVEDDPGFIDLVTEIFEEDYEILTLSNGEQFHDTVVSFEPSLILMDVDLPGKSGWELYDVLREELNDPVTPVVFLTAHANPTEVEDAHNRGCHDYITKPFSEQALQNIVAQWLRIRAQIEAMFKRKVFFQVYIQNELQSLESEVDWVLANETLTEEGKDKLTRMKFIVKSFIETNRKESESPLPGVGKTGKDVAAQMGRKF